jgi:hypothetical protein
MGSLAPHNDRNIYLQKEINAFSKYASSMPISYKSVEAVASAFHQ